MLTSALTAVMTALGLPGIVLLMALESACLPIPSEIVMPFAGYLVFKGTMSLWAVAFAGTIGCNLGSFVAYEVGARGGRQVIERWTRHSIFGAHELKLADRFFARYGSRAVFFSRMLPIVRTFVALPAGMTGMNRVKFHLYTFAGSFPWCLGLAWIGMTLGEHWNDSPALSTAFHIADAVMVAAILAAIVWYVRQRYRAKKADRAS
ncbi:DedA family protein [Fulvimarina sp. MAC3]|uniref:DedA family protein n=1 Tax=Fulvimarina sp. MAC3 TaxID=3148887 RepID=UPI0031FD0D11